MNSNIPLITQPFRLCPSIQNYQLQITQEAAMIPKGAQLSFELLEAIAIRSNPFYQLLLNNKNQFSSELKITQFLHQILTDLREWINKYRRKKSNEDRKQHAKQQQKKRKLELISTLEARIPTISEEINRSTCLNNTEEKEMMIDLDEEGEEIVENDINNSKEEKEEDMLCMKKNIRRIYSLITARTSLYHNVELILDYVEKNNDNGRRVRVKGKAATDMINAKLLEQIPTTVCPHYAEARLASFDQIIIWLINEIDLNYRLLSSSSFLDVGSGYGKCVIHAAICAHCPSVGIEYVARRHKLAKECLLSIRDLFPELTQLNNVTLFVGDVTDSTLSPQLLRATHVFCFDRVFHYELKYAIVHRLMSTNASLKVLITTIPQNEMDRMIADSGNEKRSINIYLQHCCSFPLSTTGSQTFIMHVYLAKRP